MFNKKKSGFITLLTILFLLAVLSLSGCGESPAKTHIETAQTAKAQTETTQTTKTQIETTQMPTKPDPPKPVVNYPPNKIIKCPECNGNTEVVCNECKGSGKLPSVSMPEIKGVPSFNMPEIKRVVCCV